MNFCLIRGLNYAAPKWEGILKTFGSAQAGMHPYVDLLTGKSHSQDKPILEILYSKL